MIKTHKERFESCDGRTRIDCMEAEIYELREHIAALEAQPVYSTIPACDVGPCGCKGGCIETIPVYSAAGAAPVPRMTGAALASQEPVAEVLLVDGEKVIDASMAFFDSVELGTKLYRAAGAAPVQPMIAFRHGCPTCGKLEGCEHAAAPVQPNKWTAEEIERGYVGLRWVTKEGVAGRPTNHDVYAYLKTLPEESRCVCEGCRTAGAAPSDAWKDAVIDALANHALDAPLTDTPKQIVKKLVDMVATMARDPAINAGAAPALTGFTKIVRDFKYNQEARKHIPILHIHFPETSSSDAQGFDLRDKFAAMLAAAPAKEQP